jgi:hypothetical protein
MLLEHWTDISIGELVDKLKIGTIYEVLHMMIYHIDDCEVHAGDASCPSRFECHLAEINSFIQDILATLCINVTTDFGAHSQIGCQDPEADVVCFQKKKQQPFSFISANQIVVCPILYSRFFSSVHNAVGLHETHTAEACL